MTFCSRHGGLVSTPSGQASSIRGLQPNVPAENTPAPLGAEYQVELANEALPRQFTGEWAMTWMFSGVGTPGVTRSYSLPTMPVTRSPFSKPDPSNIHADASPTTQSAVTGLHS